MLSAYIGKNVCHLRVSATLKEAIMESRASFGNETDSRFTLNADNVGIGVLEKTIQLTAIEAA